MARKRSIHSEEDHAHKDTAWSFAFGPRNKLQSSCQARSCLQDCHKHSDSRYNVIRFVCFLNCHNHSDSRNILIPFVCFCLLSIICCSYLLMGLVRLVPQMNTSVAVARVRFLEFLNPLSSHTRARRHANAHAHAHNCAGKYHRAHTSISARQNTCARTDTRTHAHRCIHMHTQKGLKSLCAYC